MEGSERLTGDEELKARIELALVHVKKIRDDARQVIQSLAQIRDDLDEQQGD